MNKSKLERRALGLICFLCFCFIAPTLHGQENLTISGITITDVFTSDRATSVTIGPESVTVAASGELDIETRTVAFIGPFTVVAGGKMQIRTHNSRLTTSEWHLGFDNDAMTRELTLHNSVTPGPEMDWFIGSGGDLPEWLTFDESAGMVPAGDSANIVFSINTSNLDGATYDTGVVVINSNLGIVTVSVDLQYDQVVAQFASPFPLSNGEKQTNYRIISVPGRLADASRKAIFDDDLGDPDPKQWRLFGSDGVRADRAYPEALGFGQGVFLLVRDKNKKVDVENVTILGDTLSEIQLTLNGWNLIGNPFNFDILLSDNKIELIEDGQSCFVTSKDLWEYTGQNNANNGWQMTGTMRAWQGYAINAKNGARLKFHPYRKGNSAPVAKAAWQIQIAATSGDLQDSHNFAGVHEKASLQHDAFDRFEPLVIGDYISLNFPHRQWSTFSKKLSADYQPTDQDGWTWEFAVESSGAEKAELTFTGFEDVPAEYSIVLVDPATHIQRDLRAEPAQTIATLGEGKAKMFKLIVGPEAFVAAETAGTETLPESFFLHQNYPNPFNPVTSIRFDLPEEAKVSLKIFDVLGREVVQLIQGTPFAGGRHSVVWDARNARGHRVSSGLYFYVLEAGAVRQVRKMTLLQ